MSDCIISVEDISKYYRLGVLGSGSFKTDLQSWWSKQILKKEEEQNIEDANSKDHIWALRNINFKIDEGDCLGIVGKNGSGKSTLLKIISRISSPTTGSIYGRGKITSLLEVGTGFHPELSGRENLFLNGQILGMKKKEILSKFDEIVDFSGIERFIDTPVKRYSSGMYVRLAFSVAAHLNTDVLIVDEVLAVGDSEFQNKCLGKMKDVTTKNGKTILFVSHNLLALANLCNKAICLNKGRLIDEGSAESVISNYLKREKVSKISQFFEEPTSLSGNKFLSIKSVELKPEYINSGIIDTRTALLLDFEFWNLIESDATISVHVTLNQFGGECVLNNISSAITFTKGLIKGSCAIPGGFLNDGHYFISLSFYRNSTELLFEFKEAVTFDVIDYRADKSYFGKWNGAVRPNFPVILNNSF